MYIQIENTVVYLGVIGMTTENPNQNVGSIRDLTDRLTQAWRQNELTN